MISVVIPYFNNSTTIQRCLESVYKQTYKDIEIIIVDDGSVDWDESQRIVDYYSKYMLVSVIHHKVNLNGSSARNTGIKSANGQFIALLDSDDEWLDSHLEKSYNYYKNINIDECLIFSSINILHKNIHTKPLISPQISAKKVDNVSDYIYVHGNTISCVTYFFPKKIAAKVKFNDRLIRFQDIEFALNLDYHNIPVYQSPHIGTIVHWENTGIMISQKKGATAIFVEDFVNKYGYLFTEKAKKKFYTKELLPLLAYNLRFIKLIKLIITKKLFVSLNLKDILRIFFYSLFNKHFTS